ncbi:hypothetical protein ACQP2K_37460 [Microbispora siamensis]
MPFATLRKRPSEKPVPSGSGGVTESEYMLAVTEAEERWLRSVVDDLRAGRLTWPASDS